MVPMGVPPGFLGRKTEHDWTVEIESDTAWDAQEQASAALIEDA